MVHAGWPFARSLPRVCVPSIVCPYVETTERAVYQEGLAPPNGLFSARLAPRFDDPRCGRCPHADVGQARWRSVGGRCEGIRASGPHRVEVLSTGEASLAKSPGAPRQRAPLDLARSGHQLETDHQATAGRDSADPRVKRTRWTTFGGRHHRYRTNQAVRSFFSPADGARSVPASGRCSVLGQAAEDQLPGSCGTPARPVPFRIP